MKSKILEIIKAYPKHYSQMIKRDSELFEWVNNNSLSDSSDFRICLYSAISQETNICKFGKNRKLSRINEGWVNCGPASTCQCTKETISNNVKNTKSKYSDNKREEINAKRKDTMIKKYGVPYNSQRDEIKERLSSPKIDKECFEKLSNKEWLKTEYQYNKRSLVDIAQELGVYYGTVGEYCRKHGFKIRKVSSYSLIEKEIAEWLKSYGIKVIENDWDILENQELDIYLPDYNLAIEVNGLFWHSYNPNILGVNKEENPLRHIEKTKNAENKNISVIHILDYEWINKKSIVKSIILTRLGIVDKLYARKLQLVECENNDVKDFLNENHLQGFIPALKNYALTNSLGNIVMVISVGKPRFSNNHDFEILRLCTLKDTIVVGGLERLFSKVKKDCNGTIISYSSTDYFSGNSYSKLGFVLQKETHPGYFWTDGNNIISRFKCQKSKLKEWLLDYDSEKTESENMFAAGYRRYWTCGNRVWAWSS